MKKKAIFKQFTSVFLALTLMVSAFSFALPQNIRANDETINMNAIHEESNESPKAFAEENQPEVQMPVLEKGPINAVNSNEVMATEEPGNSPVPFASFPVSNYAQLVTALSMANDGDTIEISNSIALTSSLVVLKEITFKSVASGPVQLTVTGDFRHMDVLSANVTFDNVELIGIAPALGGGIDIVPTMLTLNNPVIKNCNTTDDGGAIFATNEVIINGGEISNNATAGNGGGILANDVSVLGTLINNNTAAGSGGGIYSETGDVIVDGDAIIENNAATSGNGGGIYTTRHITLYSGKINNNRALNGNGGGIFTAGSPTIVTHVEISGNEALEGGGIYTLGTLDMSAGDIHSNKATTGDGGGIFTFGPVIVSGGSIRLNEAFGDGGGVVSSSINITNANFTSNTASGDGGGLYASNGTISNSVFSDNVAGGDGGGAYVFNQISVNPGSVFRNNESAGFGGGIVGNDATIVSAQFVGNKAANGGAIFEFGTSLDISGDTVIDSNVASINGGGIWVGNLANLKVFANVVFRNNSASVAYQIKPADIPLYQTQILTSSVTVPFTYAYNNFDINYVGDQVLYVVNFESNGGTAVAPVAAVANETLAAPAQPTRDGHTFKGWYKDAGLTQLWDFATETVTGNMTLYAGWTENSGGNGGNGGNGQLPKTGSPLQLVVMTLMGAGTFLVIRNYSRLKSKSK